MNSKGAWILVILFACLSFGLGAGILTRALGGDAVASLTLGSSLWITSSGVGLLALQLLWTSP
ncbi:hypothetical protein [Streptomyces sp. NPDC004528]|uniref:hypothetical protein n=1 Tax=Streptomyces sp. NPDC004528 TaxID=3154550 RepID=UPI0033A9C0F1